MALAEPEEFVWYFGYGSNMNAAQMKQGKGVEALESVRAKLVGWKLVFNLKPILKAFGSMGNITEDPLSTVHGLLHKITPADLAKIDQFEGEGKFYKRVPLPVDTYDGRRIQANVYVSFPDMDNFGECALPSLRYKKILVDGATSGDLDPEYLQFLHSIDHHPFEYDKDRARHIGDKVFTREQVAADPGLSTFMGEVFDISSTPTSVIKGGAWGPTAREFLILRTMPAEPGKTSQPVPDKFDDLTPEQLAFLDMWLHAMELEWPVVGTCPLPATRSDI